MVDGKRRKVIANSPLERAFQNSTRVELNNRIARMFYIGGLPLHFATNPNYLIPMHMLLPITFQVMFLLDTIP